MASKSTRIRRSLGLSTLATCLTLGSVLYPSIAGADPAADKASVQAQIVQKQHDLEVITEQYNDAKLQLEQINAQQAAATANSSSAQQNLAATQAQVAQAGAALYKSPSLADAQTILTAQSPQEMIDKLSTLAVISEHYGDSITALKAGEAQAADAQAQVDAAAAQAATVEHDLAAKKAAIEADLPALEAQLASLTEAERQAVLAQAGGHATASPASDEHPSGADSSNSGSSNSGSSNSGSSNSGSSNSGSSSKPAPAPPVSAGTGGSSTAQGAVSAALTRLGMPYRWAAAGPNAFDCSGLILWAYKQVGVSLPHSSSAQAASGTPVSMSSLAPGDILWMPGHVGMYIGNGQVVHAPTTGDVVKVVSVSSMRWSKAVRIA